MARERLGGDPSSLTPLTEPQIKKLVGEVIAAWEKDQAKPQALTGGSVIGAHPLTDALARTA